MSKGSHLERTGQEPRDETLHKTTITHIHQLTPSIRILHLTPTDNIPINFLPGQWLDLHAPHIPPGGFTITSAPSLPYLELAIQRSPSNPVAAFLWQDPVSSLLGTPISVRVGGSFTWPPSPAVLEEPKLRKVVFVAGGVGVNPLGELEFEKRRMTVGDVAEVIGEDKGVAVVYVCGVPQMTDEFVEGLTGEGGLGVEKERVLFEKWW